VVLVVVATAVVVYSKENLIGKALLMLTVKVKG